MSLPPDPLPGHRLSLAAIRRAAGVIDPVFLASPQFDCRPLGEACGATVIVKLETANPIRSFKGRGAGFLVAERLRQGAFAGGRGAVAASAGNWGQAVAFACRAAGVPLTLFAATTANPLKVERMRALGATMHLAGHDFDAAKDAAAAFAAAHGAVPLVDGLDPEAAEGAGTIALELMPLQPDVLLVPLGNGALLTGVARWAKAVKPDVRVIAVQAEGADAMARSFRTGRPVTLPAIDTIADGIGVRVPIAKAVADMAGLVDEVMVLPDADLVAAMRLMFARAGLVAEPAGAAGFAALVAAPERFRGARVASVLCGSNLPPDRVQDWLIG